MELIFIRHGQGVHNTAIPDRHNTLHPPLTETGRSQVAALRDLFHFREDDLFFVSPTVRTMETANILASGLLRPNKMLTPFVGPRMFPMPPNAEAHILRCDLLYPLDQIQRRYADFIVMDPEDAHLWTHGINTTDDGTFYALGSRMISRMIELADGTDRAFVIAHDGTITSYRLLLGEGGLTRADFLGEAGWHRVHLRTADESAK